MADKYKFVHVPKLKKQGLYDPQFEHDACGVGLVADIKGRKSHAIVEQGLEVLRNLEHRGARGADPETGDGAGVLVQMPHEFFAKECARLGIPLPERGHYGVGMTFLPTDPEQLNACEQIIEQVVREEGQTFLGWRHVPVSPHNIGVLAAKVMPAIRQFFVKRSEGIEDEFRFELKLYVIRKRIESAIARADLDDEEDFYICSLSSNKIVYKGLIVATQLERFYHDLADEDVKTSFILVHSRFSTNTLGTWKLAHPYRFIIHNGEINTLRGNINWMSAREAMFESPLLGDDVEKIEPIIGRIVQSDTASFDNALELLLASGRSLPHALMMMIPEAWGDHLPMEQAKKDFYEYHASMMEPWDGPALIIGTDGTQVCGVLDRNGLRPCRYLVTTDGLLVMGSETGVLNVPPEKVRFKDRISPGRMFLLDTREGRLISDAEIKKRLSTQEPYGEWLKQHRVMMRDLPEPKKCHKPDFKTLLQRQAAFGYTLEDLRMIMEPMALNGAEPVGSMGNDSPLAVLSDQGPLLFNYFKQLFAQVSNPPLDAIREELVTSLSATIGPEQNLLSETPEHCHQLRLDGPVLTNKQLEQIRDLGTTPPLNPPLSKGGTTGGISLRAKTLSTLFPADNGKAALKKAMDNLCAEASKAIAEGYTILVLSDRGVDRDHAAIPSLLATAGVHHRLIREGTRMKAGLVVESGEPREVAHFALLIGYGA
ncbi:MAG: glutamate synthase subunit alpha, partial [Chloroflexi bacterium]|nr:glutamate synthase subunit alpha [Chloroflexota bacterium]